MARASLLIGAAAALLMCAPPSAALRNASEIEDPGGDVAPTNRVTCPPPILPSRVAKNIILMVPDGMGLSNVTAARIYKNGPGGAPLNLETLEFVGYQRSWSANSTITDSAAAASAWACGEKFDNGAICARHDGTHPLSILERARTLGKATGLVATSTITHATPGAFGAHVASRSCEQEIARQYIESTHVDFLLGGGASMFQATAPDACGASGDFVAAAAAAGYTVVTTKAAMDVAVGRGASKLLGLFAPAHMTPEFQRSPDTTEPRLPETTAAALRSLERNPRGFFLLVEGSQIDFGNHQNNYDYQLGEMLAFDEAVDVVKRWIGATPNRARQTLLIIVADHETGGHAIVGPYGALLHAGDKVTSGWTGADHTGVDTVIWSQGPGASRLGRPIDNTDVYRVMADALR